MTQQGTPGSVMTEMSAMFAKGRVQERLQKLYSQDPKAGNYPNVH